MISQKCPKCTSGRVRRGYRKTPFPMKLIGRYYLLCDACNWEFTGFALPGTVSSKPSRKRSKKEADTATTNNGESPETLGDSTPEVKEFSKGVRAGS